MNWRSAADYIKRLGFDFLGVEEPLAHGDFEGMKKFSNSTNTPIILDESFLRYEHFNHIESSPKNWLINLRISKMGGILRSIEIANQAENLGLPLIIGAQVGETSILSRAALSIANHYRDLVTAQEGAFGTYLLEKDITEDPIMFGKGGVLESSSITTNSYGWGMNVRTLE
jgi:L-alanine-DL-glutamate epimerase-like enolase superfamily enzyme